MRKLGFFPLVIVLISLVGCGTVMQVISRSTNDKLMKLEVGMNREQVLTLMGDPHRREVYGESEFLIYETNHNSRNEKEKYTPIFIKSGKVEGWGRNYYDDATRSKIEAVINTKP